MGTLTADGRIELNEEGKEHLIEYLRDDPQTRNSHPAALETLCMFFGMDAQDTKRVTGDRSAAAAAAAAAVDVDAPAAAAAAPSSSSDSPWQYTEAKALLKKRKFVEALVLYSDVFKNFSKGDAKARQGRVDHMEFLHARMSLCRLATEKPTDVLFSLQDALDESVDLRATGKLGEQVKFPEDAYLAVAAYLLDVGDVLRCVLVALRGHQLFPHQQEAFDALVARCLRDRPNLPAEIESLPKDSTRKLLLEDPPPLEAQAAPKLLEVKKCAKAKILVERAAKCLETKRYGLAVSCLGELAALKVLPVTERNMFKYCSLVTGLYTGTTTSATDVSAAQKGLEALLTNNKEFLDIYYGLTTALIRQDKLDEAESLIRRALELHSQSKSRFFKWPPALASHFPESVGEAALATMLKRQLQMVSVPKTAVATCRFEDCPEGQREVYSGEGDTYVVVACSEKCSIDFHQLCWRRAKEIRGNTSAACFTPDCDGVVTEVHLAKDGKKFRKETKDSIFNVKQAKPSKVQQQKAEAAAAAAAAAAKAASEAQLEAKRQEQKKRDLAARKKEREREREQQQAASAAAARDSSSATVGVIGAIGVSLGAVPKSSRKNPLLDKLSKLDALRSTLHSHLVAKGKLSHAPPNLLSAYFSAANAMAAAAEGGSSSDLLFTMDDNVFPAPMAHQEYQRVTDVVRQNIVDFKGKVRTHEEALAEERRARSVQISQELKQERELSFYLYDAAKNALKKLSTSEARVLDLQQRAAAKGEQARRAAAGQREAEGRCALLEERVRELEEELRRVRREGEGEREAILNARDSLVPVLREIDRSGNREDMTARLVSDVHRRPQQQQQQHQPQKPPSPAAVIDDPAIVSAGQAVGGGDGGLPAVAAMLVGDDALHVVGDEEEEEEQGEEEEEESGAEQEELEENRALLKSLYPELSDEEIEEMLQEHQENEEDELDEALTHNSAGAVGGGGGGGEDDEVDQDVLDAMLRMQSEQRRKLLEGSSNMNGGGGPTEEERREQERRRQEENRSFTRLLEEQRVKEQQQQLLRQQQQEQLKRQQHQLQQQQQQQAQFQPRFLGQQQYQQRPFAYHPHVRGAVPGSYVAPQPPRYNPPRYGMPHPSPAPPSPQPPPRSPESPGSRGASVSLVECCICYNPLMDGEEFPLNPCGHSNFHRECVRKWLRENSNCPLCREHVKLEEDFPTLGGGGGGGGHRPPHFGGHPAAAVRR